MQKIFADVAAGVTKEVYLASEVDEFLAGINDADDARDEVIRKEIAAKDARIAELEKGLREIKELSPFSHEQDVTVVENIISRLMVTGVGK